MEEGYRAFKLKLGRQSIEEDIDCVRRLCLQVGSGVVLRLDPNRAWSPEEATRFVDGTRDCGWEYLEEPLRDSRFLPSWVEETGCSIALDESLGGWGESVGDEEPILPGQDDPRLLCAQTLILKPHILGGWSGTQHWILWAQQHQKQIVWSDCFGSGLGRVFLAHWAASLGQNSPVGLDTGRWFADDLIPPWMEAGFVDMKDANRQYLSVNRALLSPVEERFSLHP